MAIRIITIWLIAAVGNIVMRKIAPDDSAGYSIYTLGICIIYSLASLRPRTNRNERLNHDHT